MRRKLGRVPSSLPPTSHPSGLAHNDKVSLLWIKNHLSFAVKQRGGPSPTIPRGPWAKSPGNQAPNSIFHEDTLVPRCAPRHTHQLFSGEGSDPPGYPQPWQVRKKRHRVVLSGEPRAPAAGEAQLCGRGRSHFHGSQVSRPPTRWSQVQGSRGLQRGSRETTHAMGRYLGGSVSHAVPRSQENIRGSGGVGGPGSVRYLNSTKEPPWSDWSVKWPWGGKRLSFGSLRTLLLGNLQWGGALLPG